MSSPVEARQRLLGADRGDRAVGHRHGAVVVDAIRRCSRDRRRATMALPPSASSSPIGLSAAAVAIAITVVLFRLIGPSRTRLVAQILAAVIGAGFVIALQVAAILSYGTLSRFAVLTSDAAAALRAGCRQLRSGGRRAPRSAMARCCCFYWPAAWCCSASRWRSSRRGLPTPSSASRPMPTAVNRAPRKTAFRGGSRQQALRWKEFLLLRRDPWLVSQSLMQLLYLVPPALLLWRSFSDRSAAIMLITPVIVMAAGQLAGGLAWLTISGEDAADLVATAPLPAIARHPRQGRSGADRDRRDLRAAGRRACIRFARCRRRSPRSASSLRPSPAAAIQLWFRVQARRSQFRRRQTSSRAGHLRGSLLLDRMGRDSGAGAGGPACRGCQRRDDGSHSGGQRGRSARGATSFTVLELRSGDDVARRAILSR